MQHRSDVRGDAITHTKVVKTSEGKWIDFYHKDNRIATKRVADYSFDFDKELHQIYSAFKDERNNG